MNDSKQLSHLLLKNQADGLVDVKTLPRMVETKVKDDDDKNFEPMKETFRQCLKAFKNDKQARKNKRSLPNLEHIDYIEITFFKSADPGLTSFFRSNYGLSAIYFSNYNRTVLFAIEASESGLKKFLKEIDNFAQPSETSKKHKFDNRIKLVKEFALLTSAKRFEIKQPHDRISQINLHLTDSVEYFEQEQRIQTALTKYLKNKKIEFDFSVAGKLLELKTANIELVNEILDNFDTVYSAQSFGAGIIRPTAFGTPSRDFGFSLNSSQELPTIGIIDSGASDQTPLQSILIKDAQFDLTHTGQTIDNLDHGTGVTLLAAIGESFFQHSRPAGGTVQFNSNANILPIKVLDQNGFGYSYQELERLIKLANQQYGIRLFVLTIAAQDVIKNNSNASPQASILDQLAADLDILICISIGNRKLLVSPTGIVQYPSHFEEESSNLHAPAEAMNHLTIGAIADNFEAVNNQELTPDKSFPAVYTSKSHFYFSKEAMDKKIRLNKHFFKPDLVHCGGDADINTMTNTQPALEVLSAQRGVYFAREIGTSYSAPLVANLAVQILNRYPDLRMQTVKALLINSSSNPWGTRSIPEKLDSLSSKISYLIGHGKPNPEKCLNSSSNRVVLILEDQIKIDKKLKAISIALPPSLATANRKQILKVTATLCFAFVPMPNHHMSYCPVHLTFGFFQDLPATQLTGTKVEQIRFSPQTSWAEDYYWNASVLSNCQKMRFTITKSQLVTHQNVMKVALKSKWHGLIPEEEKLRLPKEQKFSLVIEIECLEESINLHDELQAINKLESIIKLDTDLEINDLEI